MIPGCGEGGCKVGREAVGNCSRTDVQNNMDVFLFLRLRVGLTMANHVLVGAHTRWVWCDSGKDRAGVMRGMSQSCCVCGLCGGGAV
jgi:hypothetical protein